MSPRRAIGIAVPVVFGVTLLYSLAFGLFEVAVTAHAAAKGSPAAAGIALILVAVFWLSPQCFAQNPTPTCGSSSKSPLSFRAADEAPTAGSRPT